MSLSQVDLTRIYERIDVLNESVNRLSSLVHVNVELCKECRPKVLGNGNTEGLQTRMARIEENQIEDGKSRMATVEATFVVSKGFLGVVLSVAGILGGLFASVVQYFKG